MAQRIRFAMGYTSLEDKPTGNVEIDETYNGNRMIQAIKKSNGKRLQYKDLIEK